MSKKEERLYPVIEKMLKKYYHCFKTGINTGLIYSHPDVIGVRDVGGDLSGEIEAIVVEVKRGNEPFATASGQASGYKVYAHRVYLADIRSNSFTTDEIAIANHLGIGLIQIKGNKCIEVLTSPYNKPLTSLHLLLLEKLALGRCQFCGCFFETENIYENTYPDLERKKIKKAIENQRGIKFFNFSVGERKRKNRTYYDTYERRFICPDCVNYLYDWITDIQNFKEE